ncbi:hypothetical protein QF037_008671 [Streptomyces canus]|nr:hypothetical protein [Streptomyces canus]
MNGSSRMPKPRLRISAPSTVANLVPAGRRPSHVGCTNGPGAVTRASSAASRKEFRRYRVARDNEKVGGRYAEFGGKFDKSPRGGAVPLAARLCSGRVEGGTRSATGECTGMSHGALHAHQLIPLVP